MTFEEAVLELQACDKAGDRPIDTLCTLYGKNSEAFQEVNTFCCDLQTDVYGWERILKSLITGDIATRDAAIREHFDAEAAKDPIRREALRAWKSGETPFGMKR